MRRVTYCPVITQWGSYLLGIKSIFASISSLILNNIFNDFGMLQTLYISFVEIHKGDGIPSTVWYYILGIIFYLTTSPEYIMRIAPHHLILIIRICEPYIVSFLCNVQFLFTNKSADAFKWWTLRFTNYRLVWSNESNFLKFMNN